MGRIKERRAESCAREGRAEQLDEVAGGAECVERAVEVGRRVVPVPVENILRSQRSSDQLSGQLGGQVSGQTSGQVSGQVSSRRKRLYRQ